MARRMKHSRGIRSVDFAAIEVVGALLPPETIARVAAFDMPDQSEAGYGTPAGLKLRDEIARYYQIALAHWEKFSSTRDGNISAPLAFMRELLRDCFGFDDIQSAGTVTISGRPFPVGLSAVNAKTPLIIAPLAPVDSRKNGIDELHKRFGDETRRRSATQLLQEYLNADEGALWGLAADGLVLRLMRDNASLTRPAYIEINLEKIFDDGLFSDFSALWLLIHASCFGSKDANPHDCPLEHWRERSALDGTAAREKLRLGVEAALRELGSGFLEHRDNTTLREALRDGNLSRQAFYEELLRLVYRLIFLFAAEDRNLLHMPDTPDSTRKIYRRGYSLSRLRERCIKHTALDRHHDAWEGLRALWTALARGEKRLGLAALGGLFETLKLANLASARITNSRLLKAIWHLSWFRPDNQAITRINWRDMQTEELGSVYESLLELNPLINLDTREFAFASGDAAKGNKRKTTGSYYTPDSLVQLLLDTTLDPVLDAAEARGPDDPVSEILKLSIIDPACGSGHFLLGAARRAAARIARHREGTGQSQAAFQHALREVVSHCIFGTDRNPMAVELCKVALWIEALEPGKPLSFLDARIRCGDSLVGVFNYQMLREGLPDEVFDALTGDDKTVAKEYRKINKDQREGHATKGGLIASLRAPAEITDGATKLNAMPEETLGDVRKKAEAFERLMSGATWWRLKTACDMYVAAFLMPKTGDLPDPRRLASLEIPTTEAIWRSIEGGDIRHDIQARCIDLAGTAQAFHWPLEFPAQMATGGFDCVIGNPPWERIKLQEQEFFAARDMDIAAAPNKAERAKLIRMLKDTNPRLSEDFHLAKRAAEAASLFVRKTDRFPLTGTGDVNTYALFAELFARLARQPKPQASGQNLLQVISDTGGVRRPPNGRAGVIVPTGIATDSSTSAFFGNLIKNERLAALFSFFEVRKWFISTDERKPFCIFVIGKHRGPLPIVVDIRDINEVYEGDRKISLTADDFALFNPNTRTAPLFRARADKDLTRKLYEAAPVLIRERPDHLEGDANPWGITFQTLFHMSGDSGYFQTTEQLTAKGFHRDGPDWRSSDGQHYLPLFEAKMIHHFDHRFGSYAGLETRPGDGSLPDVTDAMKASPDYEADPWYWVPALETEIRVARVPQRLKAYWRKEKPEGCLKVLAEWVLSTLDPDDLVPGALAKSATLAAARLREVLGDRALGRDVVGARITTWLGKVAPAALKMARETPLTQDDLRFIKEGSSDPLELTAELMMRKQPRWLMGWRDITNSASERTVIASVFPKVGVNHKMPLFFSEQPVENLPALIANLTSLTFDYGAKQKIGGTSLTYFYFKQLPVLAPHQFTPEDLAFLTPRVLELTYTSHAMKPWAEDLGHTGPPFVWDATRRAQLRADIDALFARKYNLTRDELRYVLDPADIRGEDYPSETFRGLKRNEIDKYGEYRTQRLVLEAFDRITGVQFGDAPIEIPAFRVKEVPLPDLAWAHGAQPQPGDTGAVLAAILKQMDSPLPIRDVRLAAALMLEPRLLAPLLDNTKTAEWCRLVGPEADPLAGNITAFAPRINTAWGAAVRNHRGNGRLIEDLTSETWGPGSGLDSINTSGWPDGRAGFVLAALKDLVIGTAVTSLPIDIQEWITNAA